MNTVTVPTSGNVPNSNTATFNSVGTFYWQAVYSGDANNNGASSPCTATNNEQLTVTKASPTISTTLSAATITVGGTAHDTSNLTGDVADTGAGTVAYSYYTNNTCTTGQVAVNTVTVPTSGNVPNSNTVTFNSAGTFYWQAVYSGDTNNNGASSPCTATNNEQLTVNKASPTITTALSSGTITTGGTANDTSNLTGDVANTGAGHGGLQLLHQQHLHDGPGCSQHGDGADQRQRAQLEHGHLHTASAPTTGRRSTAATPTTTAPRARARASTTSN